MKLVIESACYNPPMKLSEKIVSLRKEKDWTLVELGKAIGVSPNHINRYEKQKSHPSLEVIKKLAEVFNVSADYLVFDEAPRETRFHIFDPVFVEFLEKAEGLPHEDKQLVTGLLHAVLVKNQMQKVLQGPEQSSLSRKKAAAPQLRRVAGRR
jgi:transcriptional regulator with XRE-family HTH domain